VLDAHRSTTDAASATPASGSQHTTTEQLAAFALFAVVAAGTPGPSNVMLSAAGSQVGVLRGLPCLFGVTSGMAAMMFLVPLGLGSLVLNHRLSLGALKVAGAAFLLWLAWKIATSDGDAAPASDPVGYVGAAVFQWVNPKSWLVSASAAGTFLDAGAGSSLAQAAALGAVFFLAALLGCFVWLAFGATVKRVLRTRRRRRVFNAAMGALLALSIALIAR
jgi:threonine/homoserine/homoserine lactone efflux protein